MNNVYNALNGNSSPFPKQNSSNKENNWNQKPRMSKEEFAQHMKEKKNELFNSEMLGGRPSNHSL